MVYDKLTIINMALIATGNEPVTGDDGTPSWVAASTAYDRMLPVVLYKHNWPFQTKTGDFARLGASTYPGYSDIYEKPIDCLHLENVWRTDLAPLVPAFSGFDLDGMPVSPPALDYKIIKDQIHCVAPAGLTGLYVQTPPTSASWPPGFVETLLREIESLLYQGLNEELGGAKLTKQLAAGEMNEARSRVDAEMPPRVAFRSRILQARRGGIWWR